MGRLEVQTKPVTFAPSISRNSDADGVIEAGAYSISIANVAASGNVVITASGNSANLGPGETITYSASESNGTVGRVEYDASGAEALVITMRK